MEFNNKLKILTENWEELNKTKLNLTKSDIDEFLKEFNKLNELLNQDPPNLKIKFKYYYLQAIVYDKLEIYYKEAEEIISKCVI